MALEPNCFAGTCEFPSSTSSQSAGNRITLALEPGFQENEKPISEAIADSVLSKQIDGVEATLTSKGYTTKVLTEMLGVKPGQLRALFKQELGAERARDFKEQMLAASLPV